MTARIISDRLVVEHDPALCAGPGRLEFVLREPLVVEVDGVRYRAPAGTLTDGASTPRAFRNLVPRVGRHIYGAIIHDAAYRGALERYWCTPNLTKWVKDESSRPWADRAFLALMAAAHTGRLTRWMAYRAVRWFGRRAFQGAA